MGFLDGLRGFSALYVMLFHSMAAVRNHGLPQWAMRATDWTISRPSTRLLLPDPLLPIMAVSGPNLHPKAVWYPRVSRYLFDGSRNHVQ